MNRRELLLSAGAAVLGVSAFPLGWVAAADKKKTKIRDVQVMMLQGGRTYTLIKITSAPPATPAKRAIQPA